MNVRLLVPCTCKIICAVHNMFLRRYRLHGNKTQTFIPALQLIVENYFPQITDINQEIKKEIIYLIEL